MLFKRHLSAVLCMSLTLITAAGAVVQAQGKSSIPTLKDSYPDREMLLDQSMGLCLELLTADRLSESEITRQLEKHMLIKTTVIRKSFDKSGWAFDLNLTQKPGGFLKLMKNGAYFTFNFRQSEATIEAIADVSLDSNCQSLSEARFTYHNSALRPVKRVKINSLYQVVQSVVMEEPVQEAPQAKMSENAVRIGVIDSGLDYNHSSLVSKSRPMLGVDLTNRARPPYDYTNTVQNELMGRRFSHGTAVADIASRNLEALIVSVRIENQSKLSGAAVEFLAQQNVRIINLSQGTAKREDWLSFKAAVEKHPEILFIVSAGNDSKDLAIDPAYPSSFEIPNMLVVASVDSSGKLSRFSNFNSKYVHLAAVGENVTAALAGGGTWSVNGTSFAAPLVANVAAQVLKQNPQLSASELRDRLIQRAQPSPQLKGIVRYGILTSE